MSQSYAHGHGTTLVQGNLDSSLAVSRNRYHAFTAVSKNSFEVFLLGLYILVSTIEFRSILIRSYKQISLFVEVNNDTIVDELIFTLASLIFAISVVGTANPTGQIILNGSGINGFFFSRNRNKLNRAIVSAYSTGDVIEFTLFKGHAYLEGVAHYKISLTDMSCYIRTDRSRREGNSIIYKDALQNDDLVLLVGCRSSSLLSECRNNTFIRYGPIVNRVRGNELMQLAVNRYSTLNTGYQFTGCQSVTVLEEKSHTALVCDIAVLGITLTYINNRNGIELSGSSVISRIHISASDSRQNNRLMILSVENMIVPIVTTVSIRTKINGVVTGSLNNEVVVITIGIPSICYTVNHLAALELSIRL